MVQEDHYSPGHSVHCWSRPGSSGWGNHQVACFRALECVLGVHIGCYWIQASQAQHVSELMTWCTPGCLSQQGPPGTEE